MAVKLLNLPMHDGSRQFLSLPESVPWNVLRDHIQELSGAEVTGYLTDHIMEVWIDFVYAGQTFSINNPWGEYWFFVNDPACPDEILRTVANHCEWLTGSSEYDA